jgi:hypothetical protein
MMKMIRDHLYIELGNLQGLIQMITAAGHLSEEQKGLCHEIVTRLEYLRQVVTDPGSDVVSDPST